MAPLGDQASQELNACPTRARTSAGRGGRAALPTGTFQTHGKLSERAAPSPQESTAFPSFAAGLPADLTPIPWHLEVLEQLLFVPGSPLACTLPGLPASTEQKAAPKEARRGSSCSASQAALSSDKDALIREENLQEGTEFAKWHL